MNKCLSTNKKWGVGRHGKRSFSREIGRFLSKNRLVKPINRIGLGCKRKRTASGTGLLLQALFCFVFVAGSIYATKASPIPKTLLEKFHIAKFHAKTTFYRAVSKLDFQSLEAFNGTLLQTALNLQEKIIVTLDTHAIEVWSHNYADACWGGCSKGTFFGYKLFAAILHGKDIVIHHWLAPANFNELDLAFQQVIGLLRKLPRIDVLLIDRGYFSFEFFAFLIQKGIGFVTVARDDTAAVNTYLKVTPGIMFHQLNETCWYHETLLWFPALRRNLRAVFVRKEIGEILPREYVILSNLGPEYSTIQLINLYPKRQGREDVFDRLKNELKLHKPCKILDFAGIQAAVALTITAYNIYTLFSHETVGAYTTITVMHRLFLFNEIEKALANRQTSTAIEETVSKTERYKQDSQYSTFSQRQAQPTKNTLFPSKDKKHEFQKKTKIR